MKSSMECRFFGNAEAVRHHLERQREQGGTLVTTNGCFDIIHAGHVQYLRDAAALGDILVVGINSDATTRKLKGPGRPIQSQDDRCRIVAALRMVECAFVFEEDDPRAFIEILKPDIHVKGGDYTSDIIEKDTVERNGGRVEIVPFMDHRSTSSIVDAIRRNRSVFPAQADNQGES